MNSKHMLPPALSLLKSAVPRFVLERIPPAVKEAVPRNLLALLPLVIGADPVETGSTPVTQVLAARGLPPSYFTPKKGDVLIWHHNLIHGGSPRRVRSHTRKSVVCHFFASNVVCYHDLSGDPAGIGVQA